MVAIVQTGGRSQRERAYFDEDPNPGMRFQRRLLHPLIIAIRTFSKHTNEAWNPFYLLSAES